MAPLANYLRRFLRDSIVVRVCVFIYGGVFLALGVGITSVFLPAESFEWLAVALGLAITGFALFMLYAAVFGKLRILEQASSAVSDGGEVLGVVLVVAVFLAALPIAAIVKLARVMRRRL